MKQELQVTELNSSVRNVISWVYRFLGRCASTVITPPAMKGVELYFMSTSS